MKDKLFFFGNYEGTRTGGKRAGDTQTVPKPSYHAGTSPTPAGS